MRKEKVLVETGRYRVSGNMTLPSEGHRSRLSDHLNRRDQEFFTIQEAVLTPLEGGEGWSVDVLMLSRAHIHLIVPAPDG